MAPKTAKTSKDAETRIQTSDSPPCGLATSGRAVSDSPPTWATNLETSIQEGLNNISSRLSSFEQTLSAVRSEVKEFKETLGSLTEAVSAHDARIDSLESALKKMEGVNTALQQKVEDLEGRSRRNNIRIIGVPEGAEGTRPTDFVAELLPKLLGEENFNLPLVVDRAHRSLQPRPADGARPRPIIARIHLFQVKEKIMQLRRLHGPLQFRSNKQFQDHSASGEDPGEQLLLLRQGSASAIDHFLTFLTLATESGWSEKARHKFDNLKGMIILCSFTLQTLNSSGNSGCFWEAMLFWEEEYSLSSGPLTPLALNFVFPFCFGALLSV
ncbi:hypothetical protein NFI96_002270 [Prochilodus magdalenae]|nr:hypothetical protein NFI96_002270 [Prochilodus magdalenae]